jgi:hypothetical protein
MGHDSTGNLMKSRVAFLTVLLLLVAATLEAHDLFLRLDSFFVRPASAVEIRVLNGTFSKSENAITRDRLRDISVVGPAGWVHLDTTVWEAKGDTSRLNVRIGATGTYLVGASTLPREITLEAKDFNAYLADDGIPDVLAARRREGELGKKATERYSKHVKALLQAGDTQSNGFDTVLGFPAELIPLNNPYLPRTGGWLRVRALVDGKPVANQLIVAGGRPPRGGRLAEHRVRTDASGVARIRITDKGQWYVKFINMERFTGDRATHPPGTPTGSPVPDYESKWATLTFEIR